MQFDQALPIYLPYPLGFSYEEEKEQERDRKVMQSFYSRTASRIQEKVEQECDRMEYEGSMMFDEYPDKFMMEHLCRKIEREMEQEDAGGEEEEMAMAMGRDSRRDMGLRDLIGVLLFNEMYRRRCRHRKCRRFY